MKQIFGNRLKNLRKEQGEMQADLAEELKVDTSMISLWENGKNFPEVKKLIELAEHYNVSTDYLIGLSNTRNCEECKKNKNPNNYNNYGVHTGDVKF